MSVQTVLYVVALIIAIVSGVDGRVPLWISVLLICIGLLVGSLIRP